MSIFFNKSLEKLKIQHIHQAEISVPKKNILLENKEETLSGDSSSNFLQRA